MELLARLWSSDVAGFLVAIAVGLLIGIERERRKIDPSVGAAGGLRTHVVTALAGAIAAQFPGVAVLVAGAVFVAALVVVSYWRNRSEDPGLTSEITLFTTYLLGALAPRLPELAAGIGVVIALVLALRTTLHQLVKSALSERELLDLLLLAAAGLVVWPLMPDAAIDQYGVVNPRSIWGLTLLVLTINAAGYVALRRYGVVRGLPLAGFFGGFVSSTATIGAMGVRIAADPPAAPAATAAALLSSLATPLQLLAMLAVIDRRLLNQWWLPAIIMVIVALFFVAFSLRRAGEYRDHASAAFGGRAFQPLQAFVFAITVTSVTWLAAWLVARVGAEGAVWGIALGGVADAHSAVAGAATLVHADEVTTAAGTLAILGALATNTLMKLVVAAATGGRSYLASLAPGLLAMLSAAALTVLWSL